MQFILDNLSAVLISMIVSVMLLAIMFRTQESSMEAQGFYAAKVKGFAFVEMIDRDFQNLGAGVNLATDDMIVSYPDQQHIAFKTLTDTTVTGNSKTIEYRLQEPGVTVAFQDTTVTLYRIVRLVDGVFRGESPNTVSNFDISLYEADKTVIPPSGGLDNARRIEVMFEVVPPFITPAYASRHNWSDILRNRWHHVFRPINLSRLD